MATISIGTGPAPAAARKDERALIRLHQAIRPLGTVVSFMNTGAHPDDEQSGLLAYLSRGLGVRTSSVIANRGEGGQNQLGDEYGPALGVVRSRELEEASRVAGVHLHILSDELDDPIHDFGFSRTPKETLARWGEEAALARLVRVIRAERPDVVMPSFRDEYGQHGHHRAITRLTLEAVRLAADPHAFPEQLSAGLLPWQARKMYVPANPAGRQGAVYLTTETGTVHVTVDPGEFDPVLGLSYVQLGEESRAFHRSQGMGRPVGPGPRPFYAERILSHVPVQDPERSFFDGLPYTLGDLARMAPAGREDLREDLYQIDAGLQAIIHAFPDREAILREAAAILGRVRSVSGRLERSRSDDPWAEDLVCRLRVKEEQLLAVGAAAALLVGDLDADAWEVVRGQAVIVTLRAFNGGPLPLEQVELALEAPPGWQAEPLARPPAATLGHDQTVERRFRVRIPDDAPYFHPYHPPALRGVVRYRLHDQPFQAGVAPHRFPAVLPDVAAEMEPPVVMVNTARPAEPIPVSIVLRNHRPEATAGTVRLTLPPGWHSEPAEQAFHLEAPETVGTVRFTLQPPGTLREGEGQISLLVEGPGWRSGSSARIIEYDHIGRTYLVTPAELRAVAFPWRVEPVRVGYVASGFDSVAGFLERMGFDVMLLGREELLSGDLAAFDTIVLGVYAYRARPDLVAANGRLLRYVEEGGHLVVQLHRPWDNWDPDATPPYRLVIGRPSFKWRVTDEGAPVTVLQPDHPLFNAPNRISRADWDGWKKDRGLYFPSEWAARYQPLLSMSDPGWEPMEGGLLLARHGKGTYLYTSLILYYQLEQYVPGAFRLMANMVSYPAASRSSRQPERDRPTEDRAR